MYDDNAMPTTKLLLSKEPMYNNFAVACSFLKTGILFSLQTAQNEPKRIVEANLMLVLIKKAHLVGK
jgi:hypothetical protein